MLQNDETSDKIICQRPQKGAMVLGYRKYAKDYEIEYVPRLDGRRPKAQRIYVGTYYRFRASDEQLRGLRWFYLLLVLLQALLLLLPLCRDSAFGRTWYIQLPAVTAWIPWALAAASVWRLWTAGEKVEREHYDLLCGRMSGACLCMMILCILSFGGGLLRLLRQGIGAGDWLVLICGGLASANACVLFSRRKGLEMVPVDAKETKEE